MQTAHISVSWRMNVAVSSKASSKPMNAAASRRSVIGIRAHVSESFVKIFNNA